MLSWEKPLVKPMAPGSIFHHINLPSTSYFCRRSFILQSLLSNLYHKNTKNIYLIISIRSHFCKWPWRDSQPLIALVARFSFVYVGVWDLWGASYWIDTLVLKKLREIVTLQCCITLSSSRKTTASSRRSNKDFWRRCRGGLRSSQDIPSTHHKLISLAFTLFAICLSFSSPPLHPWYFEGSTFIIHAMPLIELSWNNSLGIALTQWDICCYELPKPPRDSCTFT